MPLLHSIADFIGCAVSDMVMWPQLDYKHGRVLYDLWCTQISQARVQPGSAVACGGGVIISVYSRKYSMSVGCTCMLMWMLFGYPVC